MLCSPYSFSIQNNDSHQRLRETAKKLENVEKNLDDLESELIKDELAQLCDSGLEDPSILYFLQRLKKAINLYVLFSAKAAVNLSNELGALTSEKPPVCTATAR